MQLEDYLEFPDAGLPQMRGHAINLTCIVELYAAGLTAEEISREFAELPIEAIYGAITYYLHNKAAIDAAMVAEQARCHEQSSQRITSVEQRIRAVLRAHEQEWLAS